MGKRSCPSAANVPNVFITRTFSKAYGLAGLAHRRADRRCRADAALRRVCSPYNVNAVALACFPEALADQNYIEQYVTEVCSRARVSKACSPPAE